MVIGATLACLLAGSIPSAAGAQCCDFSDGCSDLGSQLCSDLGGTPRPGTCTVDCIFNLCFEFCVEHVPTPGPDEVCCDFPVESGPICSYFTEEYCLENQGVPHPGYECPATDCDRGLCAGNCVPAATPTSTSPPTSTPPPTPTPTPPPLVCCESTADGPPACRYYDEQSCTALGGVPRVGYDCLDPECVGPNCSRCVHPDHTPTATPQPVCCDVAGGIPVCGYQTEHNCTLVGGVAAPAGFICAGTQCTGSYCVGQCIPADSTPTRTPRPNVCCEVAAGGPVCAQVSENLCSLAGGVAAPDGYVCQPDGQCAAGPDPTATETPDAPPATPTPAVCGNGTVEAGEECDDGNTAPGDGCDATCAEEPGCPPSVDPSCRTPIVAGKASIALTVGSSKNQLLWKWLAGSATDKAELGDPLASDGYLVCLYDGGGLRATLRAPAGGTCGGKPCWKDKPYGYLYKDADKTPDGIGLLKLKQGPNGQAKIKLKAQGANLALPSTSSLLSPLTIQLRRANGGPCWSASYAAPYDKDDGVNLKDKAD